MPDYIGLVLLGKGSITSLQGPTKFFAAYKQISLIGLVPTKFTINSTTNWGVCLQAALACLPTLSGPAVGTPYMPEKNQNMPQITRYSFVRLPWD